MRWNCPHCKAALAIADEMLSSQWQYSRCYQCGGFSLVRKSEVDLMKVDRIGEIKPTAKPVVKQAQPRATSVAARIGPSGDAMAMSGGAKAATQRIGERPAPSKAAAPARAVPPRFTAKQIETKASSADHSATSALESAQAFVNAAQSLKSAARMPDPLPPVAADTPRRSLLLPAGIAGAGVLAIVIGASLATQATRTTRPTMIDEPPQPTATSVVDQVSESAMAPSRAPAVVPRQLTIEARKPGILLRSGPGTEFPILGTITANTQYSVLEWKDRWFKVKLNALGSTAWVRNDLVQLISKP